MEERLVEVVSPLHGTVVRIERGAGDRVDARSAVVTVESERMRVAVEAGADGVVDEVRAVVGAAVEPGQPLVVVAAWADDLDSDNVSDPEGDGPGTTALVCTRCGAKPMEPGFLEDRGDGSGGYGRWVEGHLEIGLFGARRMGRRRRAIEVYRCLRCSHLDLFATNEV